MIFLLINKVIELKFKLN